MALLEVRDVVKRYGGLAAVDGLSFHVKNGEVFGIAGPNGAGKTTLFDTITGMVRATSGTIVFRGVEIQSIPVHKICNLGAARTFQLPSVFDSQTVLANALAGAYFGRPKPWWKGLHRSKSAVARAMDSLEFVGLATVAAHTAGPLPVFDKKRLMLASALATEPSILFLDEPFGGLTPGEVDTFMAMIRSTRDRGVTIVLIEHVMRALMALSDRVLIMNHGKKLFEGTPADVIRNEDVVEVYLGRREGRLVDE